MGTVRTGKAVVAMSRYRQLRGVARHVLPNVRSGNTGSRDPMGSSFWYRRRTYRVCCWCGLSVEPPARYWHQDCALQYRAMRGESVTPAGPRECEECGGPGEEIDHRVAISVARASGPRAYVRAFLLENLRWLCRPCHLRKTREDRRALIPERPERPGKARARKPTAVRAGAPLPGFEKLVGRRDQPGCISNAGAIAVRH